MAVAIAAVVIMGTAAAAADSGLKIGVVDIQKIYKDAPRVKQYMETLEALKQELGLKLEVRSQNLMLDENQIKELVDLKLKGVGATDKDKARIAELVDAEKKLDEEFKTLQGTAQPNDTQKARLKVLQDLREKSTTTGTALEKDYNSQLVSKAQELDDKAKVEMQEVINKVAETKALNFVISKDAVLFGGIDVTDDVIKNMDRKSQ